jgi:hypothetical protein
MDVDGVIFVTASCGDYEDGAYCEILQTIFVRANMLERRYGPLDRMKLPVQALTGYMYSCNANEVVGNSLFHNQSPVINNSLEKAMVPMTMREFGQN